MWSRDEFEITMFISFVFAICCGIATFIFLETMT